MTNSPSIPFLKYEFEKEVNKLTLILNAIWLFVKAFVLTIWGIVKGILLNIGILSELKEVISFIQPYKLIALSLGISPIVVKIVTLVVKRLKYEMHRCN